MRSMWVRHPNLQEKHRARNLAKRPKTERAKSVTYRMLERSFSNTIDPPDVRLHTFNHRIPVKRADNYKSCHGKAVHGAHAEQCSGK